MTAALAVSSLSVRFGGVHAVVDLEFEVADGESLAIVGPNGAGKTTAFNAISGYVRAAAGTVAVHGRSTAGRSPWQIARMGMTRTFQNGGLFAELTVEQNLALGRPRRAIDQRTAQLCELVGIEPAVRAGTLAYGQQKCVEIARALATDPTVLMLDEPASGVATSELPLLHRMVASAADSGIALVVIEHNMSFVRDVVPRTLVMAEGAMLADGPTHEVLARADVLEAYFGVAR